jgi:hypothetical protein
MQRIRISIFILVIACWPAAAQSAASKAAEASCRKFVQTFYDWYVAHGANFETAMKLKPGILSNDLKQALLADLAASRKNSGEIVGLEFDPFVNSQDPASHYRVGKTSLKDGTCWAEIHSVPATDKTSKPDATSELRLETGHWKFVNFHYGGDSGPENENLVSILRQLKRDREKDHGK